jgi:hypothetical protein
VQYFRDLRELAAADAGPGADAGSGAGPGGPRGAPLPAEAIAQVMSRYATEVSDQYAGE